MVPQPGQTVLDCLLDIKRNIDPTLAFRYSCGHGICGSDAVSINGTPTLLCTAKVEDYVKTKSNRVDGTKASTNEVFRLTGTTENAADNNISEAAAKTISKGDNALYTDLNPADLNDSSYNHSLGNSSDSADSNDSNGLNDSSANQDVPSDPTIIEIAPLPGFPVLRDLIVDIDQMMNQIKKLEPYLKADGKLATTKDGKIDMFEYLQKPEELKRYELLSNCISCGVCEGSCPVYAGGEAFVGPAALIAQSRFINDSRDKATNQRLEAIATADGITACQSVRACSRECPRGIDVGEEMWKLTERVKNHQN